MHGTGILGGGTSMSTGTVSWSCEWRTRPLQSVQGTEVAGAEHPLSRSFLTPTQWSQGSWLWDEGRRGWWGQFHRRDFLGRSDRHRLLPGVWSSQACGREQPTGSVPVLSWPLTQSLPMSQFARMGQFSRADGVGTSTLSHSHVLTRVPMRVDVAMRTPRDTGVPGLLCFPGSACSTNGTFVAAPCRASPSMLFFLQHLLT